MNMSFSFLGRQLQGRLNIVMISRNFAIALTMSNDVGHVLIFAWNYG